MSWVLHEHVAFDAKRGRTCSTARRAFWRRESAVSSAEFGSGKSLGKERDSSVLLERGAGRASGRSSVLERVSFLKLARRHGHPRPATWF